MIRVCIDTAATVTRAGFAAVLGGSAGIVIVDSPRLADVVLSDHHPDAPLELGAAPVVVLSVEPLTGRLIQWGVRAVLPDHAQPEQIIAALYAAVAGLVSAPVEASASIVHGGESEASVEALTPRELEAFEMLAEGLSNKQIAAKLNVSEHTAKFHVNQILGKLNAGTRTEAVMRGLRLGILKV